MNERIRELAQKADCGYTGEDDGDLGHALLGNEAIEKFAKLIVLKCAEVMVNDPWLSDVKSAARGCARSIKQHFGVEE